ncbi:BgTH12-04050 [Blumeria graminis f. sp. triticale]|uniref:BgTH12-04050 n=1 Tax=Blumeria graminis f. sp. triticale TaxID=1689686 RepID=A0A9W4CW89_BLUGR|nr:BgTH12-04050 [Blumeria graminis f. sp. triticale]
MSYRKTSKSLSGFGVVVSVYVSSHINFPSLWTVVVPVYIPSTPLVLYGHNSLYKKYALLLYTFHRLVF